MVKESNTKAFDFQSEALDGYLDSGVGVLHFKDKVFQMSVDFSLQSMLFEKIKIASESDDIKVLLLKCAHSVLGEEKNDQYWRCIIGLCDEGESCDFFGITDPATAVARVDSTLNQIILTMLRFDKFVISALQGSVVTDFLGATLAADYRIVSDDTVFTFPHIKYGLPPRVEAPMCGVMNTFSRPISGLPVGGSFSNTSRAAPAIVPFFTASASACSCTTSPRAQLIRYAVFFIMENCSGPTMPLVSGVRAV